MRDNHMPQEIALDVEIAEGCFMDVDVGESEAIEAEAIEDKPIEAATVATNAIGPVNVDSVEDLYAEPQLEVSTYNCPKIVMREMIRCKIKPTSQKVRTTILVKGRVLSDYFEKHHGSTIKGLAKEAGVSTSWINSVFTKELKSVHRHYVTSVCRVMDVDVDYFILKRPNRRDMNKKDLT